eukprot:4158022-Amphidinium_carterae.1
MSPKFNPFLRSHFQLGHDLCFGRRTGHWSCCGGGRCVGPMMLFDMSCVQDQCRLCWLKKLQSSSGPNMAVCAPGTHVDGERLHVNSQE